MLRLTAIALCLFANACTNDNRLPAYDLRGNAMGTTYTVTVIAPPTNLALDELRVDIDHEIARIEKLTSTYLPDSDISMLNANSSTDWIPVSASFCRAISDALDMSRTTEGAFDVTIGPLVNLWGFGPQTSEEVLPSDAAIDEAMQHVGFERLQADCTIPAVRKSSAPVYVDLSGWAKGHGVDTVADLLDAKGVLNYVVEIGGELRVAGSNAEGQLFAIAIENPAAISDEATFVIRIRDAAVATSGDYRNFRDIGGKRYSHTIDPRTGRPIDHELVAVTVVAGRAAYADGMATALLVLGPEDAATAAEELGVAALFALRTSTGIQYQSSSAFLPIQKSDGLL